MLDREPQRVEVGLPNRGKAILEAALERGQPPASVGTSVRDRMNEATSANMTASAIGTNRKRATPSRKNIGTKTMQIDSSENSAGMMICAPPSRIALRTSLPCSRCQLMFSIVTVASSTRIPTASARPPSVITLMVSPIADSTTSDDRMASGIDTVMISVDRQLPRNSRIINAVRHAAITASSATPVTALFTKVDWSPSRSTSRPGGAPARMRGISALIRLMMSSVETAPFFWIVVSTDLRPSTRTMFCCGE